MNIRIILYFFVCLISIEANAQLTLDDLPKIELGEKFQDSKYTISQLFSNSPIINKGDFLDTYQISFDNTPFDYYGNADYTFQFVKEMIILEMFY